MRIRRKFRVEFTVEHPFEKRSKWFVFISKE